MGIPLFRVARSGLISIHALSLRSCVMTTLCNSGYQTVVRQHYEYALFQSVLGKNAGVVDRFLQCLTAPYHYIASNKIHI